MLKGEAKKDYQRRYMKDRRAKLKLNRALVRPQTLKDVRPYKVKGPDWVDSEGMVTVLPSIDADGNVIPDE